MDYFPFVFFYKLDNVFQTHLLAGFVSLGIGDHSPGISERLVIVLDVLRAQNDR